jgi:hypothetical protein
MTDESVSSGDVELELEEPPPAVPTVGWLRMRCMMATVVVVFCLFSLAGLAVWMDLLFRS